MKEYRIKTSKGWSPWHKINVPIYGDNIWTIQFNEPLTLEEAKEFFKNYEVK